MENRDFKGIWIDKTIWLDERLTALDKVILAEINSLDNGEGCSASNEYLAKFCQCSLTHVSKAISKLIEIGYVSVKSFNGRVRYLECNLVTCIKKPCQKSKTDLSKEQGRLVKMTRQTCQNDKAPLINNINNNINNIKRESKERETPPPKMKTPTLEEITEFAQSKGRADLAPKFFDYYEQGNWHDREGKPVKNWKLKFITWLNKEPKENNTGIKHKDSKFTDDSGLFSEFLEMDA